MRQIYQICCVFMTLASCDSRNTGSSSLDQAREDLPTDTVSTQWASSSLAEAISECEEHLTKLDELNEILRKSNAGRSPEVVSAYLTSLDEWFKERLLTRAKLNAKGGMFEEADRLDLQTVDSLALAYSEAKTLLGDGHPADFGKVDAAFSKYGFHRRVLQKLSEQPGTGQPATRPVDEPEGRYNPQPESEGRSR